MFIVLQYTQNGNTTAVQNAFRVRFPDRNPPHKTTILFYALEDVVLQQLYSWIRLEAVSISQGSKFFCAYEQSRFLGKFRGCGFFDTPCTQAQNTIWIIIMCTSAIDFVENKRAILCCWNWAIVTRSLTSALWLLVHQLHQDLRHCSHAGPHSGITLWWAQWSTHQIWSRTRWQEPNCHNMLPWTGCVWPRKSLRCHSQYVGRTTPKSKDNWSLWGPLESASQKD